LPSVEADSFNSGRPRRSVKYQLRVANDPRLDNHRDLSFLVDDVFGLDAMTVRSVRADRALEPWCLTIFDSLARHKKWLEPL